MLPIPISEIMRDYTEVISTLTRAMGPQYNLNIVKESLIFLVTLIGHKISFLYNILNTKKIYYDASVMIPYVHMDEESAFFNQFFEYDEILNIRENPLIAGFLNSIFFVFPNSVAHLVAIRRLIIQGIPAATYTLGGYLAGQLIMIACVVFGNQRILTQLITLEPLNYVLGLILLGRIIYNIRFESFINLDTWEHPNYKKYFINSLLLSFCEQGTIFPFLSNLTLSANPSILQISFSQNLFIMFIQMFFYITGMVLGSILFSGLWFLFFLKLKSFLYARILIAKNRFFAHWNTVLSVLMVTIAIATIPYYSFHFLFLAPFGFMPEDRVFRNTIFTDSYVKDVSNEISSLTRGNLMELKLFPFNTGEYLIYPEELQTLSMEDLIYRSDYAWVRRMEKLSTDVVTTNSKGKKLSQKLGFQKGSKSMAQRVLPRQTPLMTYRLDLHNRFKTDDIVKPNLDVEHNEINSQKEINKEDIDIWQRLPHDPILDRYFQWYDFENLELSLSDNIIETTEINLEETDENIIYFFVRNLVQSPFLFVARFLQNQRDIGYSHYDIGLRTKQQYQQSIIYKLLLKLDISTFLWRQPRKWCLNGEHEYDLQAKRQIYNRYYDSLRNYRKIPIKFFKIFDDFFGGAINTSNQVYNQQFTGTLRNLTRFFSLTLDDEQDFSKNKILNYINEIKTEIPPTTDTNDEEFHSTEVDDDDFIEEENDIENDQDNLEDEEDLEDEEEGDLDVIEYDDSSGEISVSENKDMDKNKPSSSFIDLELVHRPVSDEELAKLKRTNITLKFDQPLYKFSKFDIGPEPHEELHNFMESFNKSGLKGFSMIDQYCSPLYVDEFLTINNKMLMTDCTSILLLPDDACLPEGEFDYSVNLIDERLKKLGYIYSKEKDKLLKERMNSFYISNWGAPDRGGMFDFLNNFVFFSCWPLHDHIIEKPFYEESIPYLIMKEYKEQVEYTIEDELTYDVFELSEEDGLSFTRPWIMEYMLIDGARDSHYLLDLFIPQKGGFVWPGIDDIYVPGIKRRKKRPMPDRRTVDLPEKEENENEIDY